MLIKGKTEGVGDFDVFLIFVKVCCGLNCKQYVFCNCNRLNSIPDPYPMLMFLERLYAICLADYVIVLSATPAVT